MSTKDFELFSSLINYCQETGVLRWKKKTAMRIKVGDVVGTLSSGYLCFQLHGKSYKCHRVAWLLTYGNWPSCNIDHINRNRRDNRIVNLRLAEQQQNCWNAGVRSTNKLGIKGVRWHKKDRKFHARISHKGKAIFLGLFNTAAEASAAVAEKDKELRGRFSSYHGHQ